MTSESDGPIEPGPERLDERQRRFAANEALFRELNENLLDLNESFGALSGSFAVVCECGNGVCVDQIEISPAAYEQARANPATFIIRAGHAIQAVDAILEDHAEWQLVQKRPGAAEDLAVETDPRD